MLDFKLSYPIQLSAAVADMHPVVVRVGHVGVAKLIFCKY